MLQALGRAAAVDRVVHPRAALLACARIQIEIELPDERAVRIVDLVETHDRVPRRRAARADGHAVDRLDDPEQPGERRGPREGTPGCPARRTRSGAPSASRMRMRCPMPPVSSMPSSCPRELARAPRSRAGRTVGRARRGRAGTRALRRRPRHLRHQRQRGEIARSRGAAPPRCAIRGCARSPPCCPSRAIRRGRTRASRTLRGAAARGARGRPRTASPAGSRACAASASSRSRPSACASARAAAMHVGGNARELAPSST